MRGKSAHIPIDFLRYGSGHNFCPSKLHRDDPTFVKYLKGLWTAWKAGAFGDMNDMDESTMDDLYDMIRLWLETERENNYYRLGTMIGGDPDAAKDPPKK